MNTILAGNDPGAYNPHRSMFITKSKAPAYGIGTEAKGSGITLHLKANSSPGPGIVNPTFSMVQRAGPKIGFGTSTRPNITGKVDPVPGPG